MFPPIRIPPVCLHSVRIFVLLRIPNHFCWLCTLYFFTLAFCMHVGHCKKRFQQSDNSSSATYMFAVHRLLNFFTECRRYHKTSLPLPWYCRILFTVSTVLPWNFPRTRSSYCGYRGITAIPVTVCHPLNCTLRVKLPFVEWSPASPQ